MRWVHTTDESGNGSMPVGGLAWHMSSRIIYHGGASNMTAVLFYKTTLRALQGRYCTIVASRPRRRQAATHTLARWQRHFARMQGPL